jgi:hypothetical protein
VFRVSPNIFEGPSGKVFDLIAQSDEGLVHVTVLPFVFTWHHKNEEIITAFEKWLVINQPRKRKDCIRLKKGKNWTDAIRKALKGLGALKLTDYYGSVDEALVASSMNGARPFLYGASGMVDEDARRSWRAGAAVAKKIVQAWNSPVASLLDQHPEWRMELEGKMSPGNLKDRGQRELGLWMQFRTLPVCRAVLPLKAPKQKERLGWICEYESGDNLRQIAQLTRNGHWQDGE